MMFADTAAVRVFLAPGATDMRKSFNGLHALARGALRGDPLSGHLFVFCNRRRDRVKILHWDGSGLWVCAKRLDEARQRGDGDSPEGESKAGALRAALRTKGNVPLAPARRRVHRTGPDRIESPAGRH